MISRKLGLGLDALLAGGQEPPAEPPAAAPAGTVPVDAVLPNPCQPRSSFDPEELEALAASIRSSGILQPLVVRPRDGKYELVAGERRLRAARLAGLTEVPAVVREVDDRAMLRFALVENIQRRDLNPMEKARAFRQLMQLNGWTQDQAAEAVGLGRPTVANFIRLLELPPEIQEAVSSGAISMGHARALLGTTNRALQIRILRQIVAEDLPVRAVEKLVSAGGARQAKPAGGTAAREPYIADLEHRLSQFFGTRVTLKTRAKGGEMIVEWFSNEQFNGLLRKLGV